MTDAYNEYLFGKIYIMGLLVKISPVMADRNLVHLVYKYTIRPIPTLLICEQSPKNTFECNRRHGCCPNCYSFGVRYVGGCDKCLGLPKRRFNIEHVCIFITPVFTIENVIFKVDEHTVTVSSKYNTMQFNTYHIDRVSIKVIGNLAYILTGDEFTIVCLLYGRVLYQWYDHRHDKEYLGDSACFHDHPLNFIVEPNGQIIILGTYRTYLIKYVDKN